MSGSQFQGIAAAPAATELTVVERLIAERMPAAIRLYRLAYDEGEIPDPRQIATVPISLVDRVADAIANGRDEGTARIGRDPAAVVIAYGGEVVAVCGAGGTTSFSAREARSVSAMMRRLATARRPSGYLEMRVV